MPAKFHQVAPTVWDRTMRQLGGPATVVRLYIMTCPNRVSEGLFQLPLGIIVHDTGLEEKHVRQGLQELEQAGLVSYDEFAEVVLDRTALKYAPLRHGRDETTGEVRRNKAMTSAVRLVDGVPDTHLKRDLLGLAERFAPDFARELTTADPALAVDPDDVPSEDPYPPPPPRGDGRGIEGGSRDETSRVEERRGEAAPVDEGPSPLPCHWCGESALVTAGELQVAPDDDGNERPYCGWCNTEAVAS